MSANNQHLIAEYQGKWYVFLSIQAESWDDYNILSIQDADFVGNYTEACDFAMDDEEYETEYGIGFELIKDGASVTLVDSTSEIKEGFKILSTKLGEKK